MNDAEKSKWRGYLLALWGGSGGYALIRAAMGGHATGDTQAFAIETLTALAIVTIAYLLGLSWRAAYLSGRKSK